MLKQRLLTVAVLLPFFIWGILSLSVSHFAILIAAMMVIGSWEWTTLIGIKHTFSRILFSTAVAVLLAAVWVGQQNGYNIGYPILMASAIWWSLALFFVFSFPRRSTLWGVTWIGFLIGGLVLVSTWVAVVALKSQSEYGGLLVIILLTIIWGADTGAYFAGRKYGKTKLCTRVSPGKSWEGAIGGLVLVGSVFALLVTLTNLKLVVSMPALLFLVVVLVTVMVSILGDLTESMFKRRVGVKDSGKLLPGHGGMLDRIDSVTAAAPLFVIFMANSVDFPFLQYGS